MSESGSDNERVPQDLFSDGEEDSDPDRGRYSEAEEDNSLNRKEGGARGGGDEEEEAKKAEAKRKREERKKKRVGPVRKQMIDENMLIGKQGISTIPELFKDFQFGGKGKERQDLDKMLCKMEHWVHQLHPKYPFDQCLERLEFLGLKRKKVKVHLKKIRMGMAGNEFGGDEVMEGDELENLDAAGEIAASASEFVEREEMKEATQVEVPVAKTVTTQDDEFPDDDDDIFGAMEESMMDEVENMDVEEDDFFTQQLKRAEAAEKALKDKQNDNQEETEKVNRPGKALEEKELEETAKSAKIPEEKEEVSLEVGLEGTESEKTNETLKVTEDDEEKEEDGLIIDEDKAEKPTPTNDEDGIDFDDLKDNDD